MQRMRVDQKDITKTQVEKTASASLEPGQARLHLDSFALTANNVTYAASGFAIGYWKFFPTGIPGQGLVPVWGTATVENTEADAIDEPVTAANTALAPTVAMPIPPLMRRNRAFITS